MAKRHCPRVMHFFSILNVARRKIVLVNYSKEVQIYFLGVPFNIASYAYSP